MNSQIKFLRRVRIHGGECGAVARALHHKARTLSLPAVIGNVSITTKERNSMSKKTFFRRAALALVTSLGIGLLSVPSSQATIVTSSLTLSAATSTATVGDTATGSWVARWTYTDSYTVVGDTATVKYTCDAPSGATCPEIQGRATATADTFNVIVVSGRSPVTVAGAPWVGIQTNGWTESAVAVSTGASARSSVSFKAANFTKAGTYTYTFYMQGGNSNAVFAGTSTTWTVTVSAPSTSASSIKTSYLAYDNAQANYWRYGIGVPDATSRDSAVVVSAGTASSPALAAVLYVVPANAAGDTRVAVADGFLPVQDTLTATITGAGTISADQGTTKSSSATMNVSSYGTSRQYAGESLTVYSNGTAGTGTIVIKNAANVTLLTKTVTFFGAAASAQVSLSDTYTSLGAADAAGSTNIIARVFDGTTHSTANRLSSGTFYVFSSDTVIVSAGATLYSNAATQYQTSGRCGNTSGQWATNVLTCALTLSDTGTASIYFADSWNVTASTFVTTAITLTVTGGKIASATVAFDKATYAPGERAIITITGKDVAGRVVAGNNAGTFAKVTSAPNALTLVTNASQRGTSSSTDLYSTTLVTLAGADDGVETRVITMPTYGTDVTYSVEVAGHGVNVANTVVTATAKVVDPNATAIAASTAAAEAATDAAAEAIDAANAATDAANLAAEAADAATVAAEEARDAADAATAAVEELATQVATLMAALKAQITTLANTVAKIAKKVKA
jgi:hypothetical protein